MADAIKKNEENFQEK